MFEKGARFRIKECSIPEADLEKESVWRAQPKGVSLRLRVGPSADIPLVAHVDSVTVSGQNNSVILTVKGTVPRLNISYELRRVRANSGEVEMFRFQVT